MPTFGKVDAVKYSFFFTIILTWNRLPGNIVSQSNSASFTVYADSISVKRVVSVMCRQLYWPTRALKCNFDANGELTKLPKSKVFLKYRTYGTP